jgi:hypothetical protein
MKSPKPERKEAWKLLGLSAMASSLPRSFPLETLAQYATFPWRMFISLANLPSLAHLASLRASRALLP